MVDEGFLAEEQLARALEEQARTGRPLGTILVELGFVSAGAVSNALAEQHGGLLKTEFGISAGLHALPGGAPREPKPAAQADPVAARVHELEDQLRTVLTERNAFAQNLNELNARLREAAQAKDAEVARVTAAAAAHIDGLEAKLREAAQPAPTPAAAPDPDAARVPELESELRDALTERNALAQNLNELNARLQQAA